MNISNKFDIDELRFHSVDCEFDVDSISSFLNNLPVTFAYPQPDRFPGTSIMLICPDQVAKEFCRQLIREKDGDVPFVGCAPVDFNTRSVGVGLMLDDYDLVQPYQFMRWLTQNYRCTVTDGKGRDWTATITEKGINALFEVSD